jgi:hypothetical protein
MDSVIDPWGNCPCLFNDLFFGLVRRKPLTMGNTSIIIPLAANGFGSRQNDQELRYCLRSIERHLTGYGDIFLIGHLPKWVRGCIHIPATDEDRTWWKERNIYRKILLACEDPRVSDDFLFMNDDHFLLSGFVAGEFPYYFEGRIREQTERDDQYGATARNTSEWLLNIDHPYFDIHAPIRYNKAKFNWCVPLADWDKKHGYCIKSIYSIINGVDFEYYPDLKINQPLPPAKIKELISGRPWFSVGNKAFDIGGGMGQVLQELYPNKSKFEI